MMKQRARDACLRSVNRTAVISNGMVSTFVLDVLLHCDAIGSRLNGPVAGAARNR